MLDQSAIDLLASLDTHSSTSPEVETFYNFFTLEVPLKSLLFFLYARSLAERELSVVITKLPSNQDVRNITLTAAQCKKLTQSLFQNSDFENKDSAAGSVYSSMYSSMYSGGSSKKGGKKSLTNFLAE